MAASAVCEVTAELSTEDDAVQKQSHYRTDQQFTCESEITTENDGVK